MKTCRECNNNVFGGGFCKYHQYRRYMVGGDKFKSKPYKDSIKKESFNRAKDKRYYAVKSKEFWNNAVKTKTNICFFCDKIVESFDGLHHLRGRIEKNLTDFKYVVICHNLCHLKFHFSAVEDLIKESWYADFMIRLKEKDLQSYNKQKRKEEKSQEIFDFD